MRLQGLLALSLLFAVTSPLTFADDAKEEAVKKERKQFEGTWQVVSLEVDGNKVAENARKITVINESDGKWTIEVDGKVLARGTSTLDPRKTPKAVDLTQTEGEGQGKTSLGIYEFKDDTRKVCYGQPDGERPTEFSSKKGHLLAVLKRVKK